MDLSKDTNVSKAKAVFKQIYTNKPLVKDMVWTKNYQTEMERAEGFRNCVDPEKCGGQYWEDGIKFMQYKREEFRNATRDESMGFGDVEYIPYNNMMEDAIKAFKEVEHEVKFEKVGGKYKITTIGGKNSESPLALLFGKLYGNNPKYVDQFKVLAYNQRKDWIYNAVSKGDYNSLEEASVGFVEKFRDDFAQRFNETARTIDHDHQKLEEAAKAYQEDMNNKKIKPGSKEDIEGRATMALLEASSQLQGYNDMLKRAQKGMYSQATMDSISGFLDDLHGGELITQEINTVADTMAKQKMSVEYEEDKYGLNAQKFSYDIALEKLRHKNKLDQIALENDAKGSEFRYQALVEAGNYNEYKTQAIDSEKHFKVNVLDNIAGLDSKKKQNILKNIGVTAWNGDFNSASDQAALAKLIVAADASLSVTAVNEAIEATQTKIQKLQSSMNDSAIKSIYNERKAGITPNTYNLSTSILTDQQISDIVFYHKKDVEDEHFQDLILQIYEDPAKKATLEKYLKETGEDAPPVVDDTETETETTEEEFE
jgi:hypothetical protein